MDVPTAQHHPHDERLTWRSLFLGAGIWFLHLNVVYGLSSLACKWDWLSFTVAGVTGLQLVNTLLTLAALALLAVTIYWPWRHWRSFQSEKPPGNPHLLRDTEKDRRPLVAFITMLLNSLFFLFVLASLVPLYALNVCA
jgi:hypothetical protein